MSKHTVAHPATPLATPDQDSRLDAAMSVHQITAMVYIALLAVALLAALAYWSSGDKVTALGLFALAVWILKAFGSRMDRVLAEQAEGKAGEF